MTDLIYLGDPPVAVKISDLIAAYRITREALNKYAWHADECHARWVYVHVPYPCTCGLDEAKAAADALVPPEATDRVFECSMRGHDFEQIMVMGNDVPVALVCGNCGKRALVTPEATDV